MLIISFAYINRYGILYMINRSDQGYIFWLFGIKSYKKHAQLRQYMRKYIQRDEQKCM